MSPLRLLAATASLVGALWGCKPVQPTIIPRAVAVSNTTSAGLGLRVHMTANNPNRVDFTAHRIDAHVTMAGTDLGRTSVTSETRLPSNTDVGLDADLTVAWNDLPRLLMITAMNETVSYHLDGTVQIGSSDIHFDVPFRVDSTLPRQLLVDAARNSVPHGATPIPAQLPSSLPAVPAVPSAGQF